MIRLNRTTEYGLIALRHMSRNQDHVTSAREIAANLAHEAFGRDDNALTLFDDQGEHVLARGTGPLLSSIGAFIDRLEAEGAGVERGQGDVVAAHDADDLGVGRSSHDRRLRTTRFTRVSDFNILLKATERDLDSRNVNGEIHPGEAVEEKVSLSERFGVWVSFHPFGQDDYLDIVAHWLGTFKLRLDDDARYFALQWALERASRSGRVAQQFARDWAGKKATASAPSAPAAIGERIR